MWRALSAFVVLFGVLALVAGCQSLPGLSGETLVDDAAITASVKTKLVADKASNLTRIDVDTNRGTVYLTGSVDTTERKKRAERLAWRAIWRWRSICGRLAARPSRPTPPGSTSPAIATSPPRRTFRPPMCRREIRSSYRLRLHGPK